MNTYTTISEAETSHAYSVRGAYAGVPQRFPAGKIKLKSNKFNDNINKVLLTWIFDHSDHPYPTTSEKAQLMRKTGLSKCKSMLPPSLSTSL